MRKFSKLLLVLLLMVTLMACSNKENTEKTTVDSLEEWKALFEPSKYKNVKIRELVDSEEMKEDFRVEFTDDVIHLYYYESMNDFGYYYYKDNENLQIVELVEIAEDAYSTEVYSCASKEELDATFESYGVGYITGEDYINQYDNAVYDEEKKCYRFSELLYDTIETEVEIYVKNGIIYQIISYMPFEYGDITNVMTIETNAISEIKVPENKIFVDSKEEWSSLFEVEKFKNCSSYTEEGEDTYIYYIDNDVIEELVYSDEIIFAHIEKGDDASKELYYVEQDDETYLCNERSYSDLEGLSCFEDHYIVNTIGKDYSEYYDQLEKCEDHYELQLEENGVKELISFYISNGYIVRIDITSNDALGNETYKYIEIYNYNHTSCDRIEG